MEKPEEEPVSRITHLIRVMNKHIKQMSKALNDLEKTELPQKYIAEADSGKDELQQKSGGNDNPDSKP